MTILQQVLRRQINDVGAKRLVVYSVSLRNDVSPFGHNDVMFAIVPKAHIISFSFIIDEVNIICLKGKHH